MLALSYESFSMLGIMVSGFRCPYLSYDGRTIEALEKSPFAWTSNDLILWDSPRYDRSSEKKLDKLGAIYNISVPEEALSLPRRYRGLVEIPITGPDDEMMFERYRVRDPDEIACVWLRAFKRVYERGELFHLLFHPERFSFISGAASFVVNESMKHDPPVWHATLGEITAWWDARADSKWLVDTARGQRPVVTLKGPPHSTVLIKNQNGPGDGYFYRGYRVLAENTVDGEFSLETESPESHMIALDGSDEALKGFLKDEGFIVGEGPPNGASFSLELSEPFSDKDRLKVLEMIDEAPYPLLRLWRWPGGARCAFSVSSDVDSITVADFLRRLAYF